jgi:membrane fusion protein (multidrug efflux system)
VDPGAETALDAEDIQDAEAAQHDKPARAAEKEKNKDDGKPAKEKGDRKNADNDGKDDKDDSGDSGDSDDEKKDSADQKPKKPPLYKRPAFVISITLITLVLIIGGIVAWLILRQYASTDDAYIDGHVVQISPQVSAQVVGLHIEDNQFVHRGDLLVRLDPTDYEVALEQAKAQVSEAVGRLAQAKAQIESAKASVPQAQAREHAAQASLANALADLDRYRRVDERARSRQQLDTAGTTTTNANAQVEEAHAGVIAALANVTTAEASAKAAEGQLQTAKANQKRAEVNLSYCEIRAPCDGRVTQRSVEAGNYVTVGQALFLLVDPNVWVVANFKETQLTRMRPGQPVNFKVDAFPNIKYHGHVDSIQAGSGSRFSVLPAENATGNFVKIVQRVPVKILFDHSDNTNDAPMLSPGLSVRPWVKIR